MFQICRDVEAVGFPVQNVYKMTYGDKNTTFGPKNRYTIFSRFERKFVYKEPHGYV